MCGRYTLATPAKVLTKRFHIPDTPDLPFRYNIAPTQTVPVVRSLDGARSLAQLRWGLIPSWAKDAKIAYRLINARADSVESKPSFRSAFRKRRCLILADGFYEWKKDGKAKQPYFIHLKSKEPFAFAGLWEHWQPEEGEAVESCTIVTTEANEFMKSLHERMPVILEPNDEELWINPDEADLAKLQKALKPYPDDALTAYAISDYVNNPRHQGEECSKEVR